MKWKIKHNKKPRDQDSTSFSLSNAYGQNAQLSEWEPHKIWTSSRTGRLQSLSFLVLLLPCHWQKWTTQQQYQSGGSVYQASISTDRSHPFRSRETSWASFFLKKKPANQRLQTEPCRTQVLVDILSQPSLPCSLTLFLAFPFPFLVFLPFLSLFNDLCICFPLI